MGRDLTAWQDDGELAGVGVAASGGGDVWPGPSEHQVAGRARGQSLSLWVFGGPGEAESGGVVGGEDLGVVADPVPGHRLDPRRGPQVAIRAAYGYVDMPWPIPCAHAKGVIWVRVK